MEKGKLKEIIVENGITYRLAEERFGEKYTELSRIWRDYVEQKTQDILLNERENTLYCKIQHNFATTSRKRDIIK